MAVSTIPPTTTPGYNQYGGLYNIPSYTAPEAAGSLAIDTAQGNLAASGLNVQLSNIINAQNRAQQQLNNNARLGDTGVATQNTLLNNASRNAQGLLDPQTEQMLQSGIAAQGQASGMGVDSSNLASAYRRALGLDIQTTEQLGQKNYLDLLAANPGAPLYDMATGNVTPGQYSSTAANAAGSANDYAALLAQLQAQAGGQQTGTSAGTGTGAGTAARSTGGTTSAAPRIGSQPTAAQANTVPFGFNSLGNGGSQSDTSAADTLAARNKALDLANSNNYQNPFDYSTPGATLAWSGQDWSSLFGNPYDTGASGSAGAGGAPTLNPDTGIYDYGSTYTGDYSGTTGTTGNLGDLGLGDWYQTGQQDYSQPTDQASDPAFEDWLAWYGE